VAIIGSVYSSVYASQVAGGISRLRLAPAAQSQVTSSIGGAFATAAAVGGTAGRTIAEAAGQAFVAGMHRGVIVGAVVALAGAVVALVYLPARAPEAADQGIEADEPNVFGLVEGQEGTLLLDAEVDATPTVSDMDELEAIEAPA